MEIQKQNDSLYAITNQLLREISLLSEEDQKNLDISTMFDSLNIAFEEKLDRCVIASKILNNRASFYLDQAEQMTEMAKALQTQSDRLKERMKESLLKFDLKSIQTPNHKITVGSTKGSLVIDKELIPQEFKMQIVEWVPDKERIRKAIDEGGIIEGAEIRKGLSLRITPKGV